MTNSWAMLFDHLQGGDDRPITDDASGVTEFPNEPIEFDFPIAAAGFVPMPGAAGEDTICLGNDTSGIDSVEFRFADESNVVITEDVKPASGKDATFWKYSEGKILREVEAYLSSTYKGHYVGEETKIQTLDLIESIGDAEAFCRSNAIKYLSRFGKKEGKNPKDLLKVIHYAFLLYHFSELPFAEDATKETFSPMGR